MKRIGKAAFLYPLNKKSLHCFRDKSAENVKGGSSTSQVRFWVADAGGVPATNTGDTPPEAKPVASDMVSINLVPGLRLRVVLKEPEVVEALAGMDMFVGTPKAGTTRM